MAAAAIAQIGGTAGRRLLACASAMGE